jgi:hypothetical protein
MSYLVNVENAVTEIEIVGVASDNNAIVAGNGIHSLDVGNNVIDIIVTSSNGQVIRTYTIYVIRKQASNNANLKNISVTPGLLVPHFDVNIMNYTVNFVDNAPYGVVVMSEPEDVNARISGNGYYPLNTNHQTIDIVVTAEDGTTKTYTITVTSPISGINEIEENHRVIIYPNPVKREFFIKSDSVVKNIKIYNPSGICVKKETSINSNKIDISGLSSGLYFIYIYMENCSVIRKLIIS